MLTLAGLALSSPSKIDHFGFGFGAGGFRDSEIFDSANAPPSRYLLEIGRRMIELAPQADQLIIGNPLLPLTPSQLERWTQGVRGPVIVTDKSKFPLLYILPRRLFDEGERFLLLLSTVDATLDARVLGALTGQTTARLSVPNLSIVNFPVATTTQWFMGEGRQQMLKLLTMTALQTIERNPAWRSLPFATYQPYHAGSLLFLNLASRQVERSLYQKQIVCWSYKDIVDACPGRQTPVWLRLPWLPRDNSVGELEYLARALDRLGPDVTDTHFFGFMRYSRIYSATPFHLMDQMKFALGDSMRSENRTIHGQAPLASARPALAPRPLKLLFHLVGGWSLKSYRDDLALQAFKALKFYGCEITVIDRPDLEQVGLTSIQSGDTARLTEAARNHHIFIGVDSFPHHFVRHVLGLPTIGLFSNTKPCNSDAKAGPDYRPLVGALPCNPCGGHDTCPLLGRKDCANFVETPQLVAAILEMAGTLYGFTV